MLERFTRGLAAALLLVLLAPLAAAGGEPFLVPIQRECPPTVWFQALANGQANATHHSGMVHLGALNDPLNPATIHSGWLSWTPEGVWLTTTGGALTTVEVLQPSGVPLTSVRGITQLAAAFEIDNGGATVFLHAGALIWDAGKVWLVLIGGGLTVVEVADPAGLSIANVKGIVRLAGIVDDTLPGPGVNAVLASGSLIYTPARVYLFLTGGALTTLEVLDPGGAPIAGTRGIQPMGGNAVPFLDSAAFLWTPTHVYLVLTGGALTVTEVLDPVGAPIPDVWGLIRESPLFFGGGPFAGLVSIFTPQKEYLTAVGGGILTLEVTKPAGGSIHSDVHVAANHALLRQASLLFEVFGVRLPPTGGVVRGTIVGLDQ